MPESKSPSETASHYPGAHGRCSGSQTGRRRLECRWPGLPALRHVGRGGGVRRSRPIIRNSASILTPSAPGRGGCRSMKTPPLLWKSSARRWLVFISGCRSLPWLNGCGRPAQRSCRPRPRWRRRSGWSRTVPTPSLPRVLRPVATEAPVFPLATSAIAPLRTAAEATGSGDFSPLWCGQNASGCRENSAVEILERLIL